MCIYIYIYIFLFIIHIYISTSKLVCLKLSSDIREIGRSVCRPPLCSFPAIMFIIISINRFKNVIFR